MRFFFIKTFIFVKGIFKLQLIIVVSTFTIPVGYERDARGSVIQLKITIKCIAFVVEAIKMLARA